MGMKPADFWQMSWRDFQLKQRGFFQLQTDIYRGEWERARFIAFYAASGFLKKGTKMKDLIRFDWEHSEVRMPDAEELRYMSLKYGKFVDEKGNFYNA